jgi:23S rRNA (uracil1939-C5)-methyltransferase
LSLELYQTNLEHQILPPLTVETLVNGGSGLARFEGRVVFIPHSCVGDRVRVRVVRAKKKYLEAQLIEVLQPAPERQEPLCPVAGDCGGCQWQHLSYADQLHWKQQLFVETLSHQCEIPATAIKPIIPSVHQWHYRSRVQIKCFNRDDGFITGFYRPRSRYVVAVDQCPIMDQRLNRLMADFRALFNGSVFADHIPQIDLTVDDAGKCAAIIHYLGPQRVSLKECLRLSGLDADLLVQFGSKKSLQAICGDGRLEIHVDAPQISLNYSAGSFAQINLQQNKVLIDTLTGIFPWNKDQHVLELYCGMGNLSFPLARRVQHLVGIEESVLSIRMAQSNSHQCAITNLTFMTAAAEDVVKSSIDHNRFDVVVLDPPRTGAYSVVKYLVAAGIPNILYVSCDPQTLARDLRPLIHSGYQIVSTQPLDMFPQTYHCESVTLLQKLS